MAPNRSQAVRHGFKQTRCGDFYRVRDAIQVLDRYAATFHGHFRNISDSPFVRYFGVRSQLIGFVPSAFSGKRVHQDFASSMGTFWTSGRQRKVSLVSLPVAGDSSL